MGAVTTNERASLDVVGDTGVGDIANDDTDDDDDDDEEQEREEEELDDEEKGNE